MKAGEPLGEVNIPQNFSLSFKLKPTAVDEHNDTNIIHFTKGGDCCEPGQRMPAIFFAKNTTNLNIILDLADRGNWGFVDNVSLPIGETTSFKMIVFGNKMQVSMNSSLTKYIDLPSETIFGAAFLYVSDIFNVPAKAVISEIELSDSSSSASDAQGMYLKRDNCPKITSRNLFQPFIPTL